MQNKNIVYRVSPAHFLLILGGKRISQEHPDVFLKMTRLSNQWLSQYYRNPDCTELLHESKSRIQ
jgi:hypothetical protein